VINFTPLGVSEKEVGFIGFVSTVTYCGIAPFVAFLMDRVKKHFKSTLTFLCVASTVCFLWLGLLCVKVTLVARVLFASSFNSLLRPVLKGVEFPKQTKNSL
jgi:sugar phosphate permease